MALYIYPNVQYLHRKIPIQAPLHIQQRYPYFINFLTLL